MRDVLIKQIDKSLPTQVKLSSLQISDHEIEGIIALLKEKKPDVEEIFMDNNLLSDEGAQKLSKAFSAFPKLSFVDLQFNKIGMKGAEVLEAATLESSIQLALCGNPDGGVADAIQAKVFESKFKM